MAKTWNPKAPPVIGLEWLMTGGADSMLQANEVRDLIMPSTQAETVTGFGLQVRDVGASAIRPSSLVEVFDNGQQHVAGPITTTIYRPTADVGAESDIGGTSWRSMPGGGAVNLWSFIDDAVIWPPAGAGDYIDYRGGAGPSGRYVFQIGSGAFAATQRVLEMRLHMVLAAVRYGSVSANRQFVFRLLRISDGATRTPVGGSGLFATPFTTEFTVNLGEINPFEDRPWLPADVVAFAPGGDYAIRCEGVGDTSVAAAILSMEVAVDHMTENRLAVGMWRRPASQASGVVNTTSLITLPGGAANWAKANAPAVHAYRWRIPHDFFIANPLTSTVMWRTTFQQLVAAGERGPHDVRGQTSSLTARGLTAAQGAESFAPALNLTVAGAPSSDSQPYWMDPDNPYTSATPTLSLEQRFTPGSTQSYLPFRFLIAPGPDLQPTDAVTFSVRRVSDNVQMGGSFVLTGAALASYPLAAAGGWRIIEGFLSAGTGSLVSGTQYAMRWTVTAGATSWRLPLAQTSSAGNPSFGGTSGCATARTEPGGVSTPFTTLDIPGVLLQQPNPIVSAQARVEAQPTRLGVSCMCNVESIDHVLITWVGAVISGFVRIEIERLLDTGHPDTDAWHLVARKLSNPLTQDSKWTDREVPRNTPAKYRLRYIDSNGSFSAWTETGFATPRARKAEVILTSNEVPDITVVYEHEPRVAYDLLDFGSDVLLPVDGADYQVAFVATEVRGVATRSRVIANFGRQPCDDLGRPIGKRRIYEPMIRAARAEGLRYVCVLDAEGNRTFAHVEFANGDSDAPGWRYWADMTVTPVQALPVAVDVP